MIKVAIIEDLANYRNALEILLNGSPGFTCCGAFESAEAALKGLPELNPDVALVDIHLPGINGIMLVKFIRETLPNTLCMMCTAYDEDEDVFKALEAGAHGYLLKSKPPAKILATIQKLINGGSPMSNEIARRVVMKFQQPPVAKQEIELSKREIEVLQLLAQDLLYKVIVAKYLSVWIQYAAIALIYIPSCISKIK